MSHGLLSIGDDVLVVTQGSNLATVCKLTDVTFDPTSTLSPIQIALLYPNGQEEHFWINMSNIIGQSDGSVYIDLNPKVEVKETKQIFSFASNPPARFK